METMNAGPGDRANIATLTGEENIVTAPGANAFECRESFQPPRSTPF